MMVSNQTTVRFGWGWSTERAGQILQILCSFPPISTHQYISLGQCKKIMEWSKESNQGDSRRLRLSNIGVSSASNLDKNIDTFSLKHHIWQFIICTNISRSIVQFVGISKCVYSKEQNYISISSSSFLSACGLYHLHHCPFPQSILYFVPQEASKASCLPTSFHLNVNN